MSIIEEIWELKIEHYTCDDPYLSCPMSTDPPPDYRGEPVCLCIAEAHNARVDAIVTKVAEMLMYQSLTYAAYGIEQDTDNPFVTTVTTEATNDKV